MNFRVNKVIFFLICSIMGLSFGQEKGLDIRMSNHVSFSPFYIWGNSDWKYSVGLEMNRWYKPLESGYHLFDYGSGLSLYYYDSEVYRSPEQKLDNEWVEGRWEDKYGLYLSPLASMYYMCSFFFHVGVSVSPEVGFGSDGFDYGASARAWFHAVGVEFRWTENRGTGIGFYIYLPVYGMKL